MGSKVVRSLTVVIGLPGVRAPEQEFEASPQRPEQLRADVAGVDQPISNESEARPAIMPDQKQPRAKACALSCELSANPVAVPITDRPLAIRRPLEVHDSRGTPLEENRPGWPPSQRYRDDRRGQPPPP